MRHVFVHREGRTSSADRIEPAWLDPAFGATLWVDIVAPDPDDERLLRETFSFHELSVEDALGELHHPKVEAYDGYLYLILHGIDLEASRQEFSTQDIDFFLGPNYLVTVRGERSRSLNAMRELCLRNHRILGEGPAAFLHRIVDTMVDHYRPEVDTLDERIDTLEADVLSAPEPDVVRTILGLKRNVTSLRRVVTPQRDVVGRLARREFAAIDVEIAYRFRDVHDQLVRLADEALIFQDRVTAIFEAYLSMVSNRLNEVMKVLTIIATIFMPLTVLTGLFGMNVRLPGFAGGDEAQFFWIAGLMLAVGGGMLWWFRRRNWL